MFGNIQQWREERDKLVSGLEQILKKKDAEIANLKQQASHSGNSSQVSCLNETEFYSNYHCHSGCLFSPLTG